VTAAGLALRVSLVCGLCSLGGWIVLYTAYDRWWGNPVGRSLAVSAFVVAGLFAAWALPLFFPVPAWAADWVKVAFTGLVSPVMWWRMAVFVRFHRAGRLPRDDGT